MAPHKNVSDCGAMWRIVAHTKLNCGATTILSNKKKKVRHISPHIVTFRHLAIYGDLCRSVAKCGEMWR